MDVDGAIADRMKWARVQAGMTPERYARELYRCVPEHGRIDGQYVTEMESGEVNVLACYLVAAARILGQPVSVVLGEMDAFEVTLPALERKMDELFARWQEGRIIKND